MFETLNSLIITTGATHLKIYVNVVVEPSFDFCFHNANYLIYYYSLLTNVWSCPLVSVTTNIFAVFCLVSTPYSKTVSNSTTQRFVIICIIISHHHHHHHFRLMIMVDKRIHTIDNKNRRKMVSRPTR